MRKLVLLTIALLCFSTAAFAATEHQTAKTRELHHFAFPVPTATGGIVTVVKTAHKQPESLFPAYLHAGEIYRASFKPDNGRFELDFAFWDPGRYAVQVAVQGQPVQVQAVRVDWPVAQYARTVGLAALLAALGLLVGYVSYTLPRPMAAAGALFILLGSFGPARAHGNVSQEGAPRAYEVATLTFDLPPMPYDVALTFRHEEDQLDLIQSRFHTDGPVTFSYLFPEGAPYRANLVATPVGGGAPVELSHDLEVEPVHPTAWESWRGWLVGMAFFLAGGGCGLWLGSRNRRRTALVEG